MSTLMDEATRQYQYERLGAVLAVIALRSVPRSAHVCTIEAPGRAVKRTSKSVTPQFAASPRRKRAIYNF